MSIQLSEKYRGTGRTTKQMMEAPKGAVFVWCNKEVWYPQRLAEKLGRKDLQIQPRSWLTGERWRGQSFPGIVVDHALHELMSSREYISLREAESRVRGTTLSRG